MSIYDSALWTEDLDLVLRQLPVAETLAGASIVITGAGGLIGSTVADLLIRRNETQPETEPTEIYAAARSEGKIRSRFGAYADRAWFHFTEYDATAALNTFPDRVDYIIHAAGIASPDRVMQQPVETMSGNFLGLKQLLDYAGTHSCRRVLYISSSEVYGKKTGMAPFREDNYGYIDLLNPRNAYSIAKRASESLCAAYATEYLVDSVIVRPGHVYGPTAGRQDHRVSSAWAYDAAEGKDLIMKSNGAQLRSYCYCPDCAAAILLVLLRGEHMRAYNISNPDSVISIRQMAELLCEEGHVALRTESPSEAERRAFVPMDNSSLESSSLLRLGWKGCFDARTGFSHTVRILKECLPGTERLEGAWG